MSRSTPHSNEEAWLAYLDKEYLLFDKGSVEHDMSSIIKHLLLSKDDCDSAVRTAARDIDTYYWDRILEEYGTLFVFQKKEIGFTDFHDYTLVRLLLELPKLFSRPDKVALEYNRIVSPDEPLFSQMLDDAWGGNFASNTDKAVVIPSRWEAKCREWVNFSHFLARCMEAQIDDKFLDLIKYARLDILEGLEKAMPPGLKRDTRVTVATQYILLAENVIDEEFVQKPAKEGKLYGMKKWQLWASKLQELAGKELASEVKNTVVKAR